MAEQLAVEVDVKNVTEFDVKNVMDTAAAAVQRRTSPFILFGWQGCDYGICTFLFFTFNAVYIYC